MIKEDTYEEVFNIFINFCSFYYIFNASFSMTNDNAPAETQIEIPVLQLDSDIEKVKVTSKGLQGYNIKSLSWLSGVEFSGTVTIN